MANTKATFDYDYETLLKLTNWSYGRVMKDVSVGELKPDNIVSVAEWLLLNGKPWVRGKLIAKALLSIGRAATSASPEALSIIFQQDEARRKVHAKKVGRRKKVGG